MRDMVPTILFLFLFAYIGDSACNASAIDNDDNPNILTALMGNEFKMADENIEGIVDAEKELERRNLDESQSPTKKENNMGTSSGLLNKRGYPQKSPCYGIGKGAPHWVPGLDTWCANNCPRGYCPSTHCICGYGKSWQDNQKSVIVPKNNCYGVDKDAPHWVPGLDTWCANNCPRGFCPSTHCTCGYVKSVNTGHGNVSVPKNNCYGVGKDSRHWVPGLDPWCANNCLRGYCPSTHCLCH